jgi:hypothetical protein
MSCYFILFHLLIILREYSNSEENIVFIPTKSQTLEQ